jgi:hypothetical protein
LNFSTAGGLIVVGIDVFLPSFVCNVADDFSMITKWFKLSISILITRFNGVHRKIFKIGHFLKFSKMGKIGENWEFFHTKMST